MNNNYNQLRAMLAIARGSFKGMLRNPSAVAFGFGFPLVIILVFGSIGGGGPKVSVALARQADRSSPIVQGLVKTTLVSLDEETDTAGMRRSLERGRIAAIITVDSVQTSAGIPQFIVHTQTSSASGDKYPILQLAIARVFQIGVERN